MFIPILFAGVISLFIWFVQQRFDLIRITLYDSVCIYVTSLTSTFLSLCLRSSLIAVIPIVFMFLWMICYSRKVAVSKFIFLYWSLFSGWTIGMGFYLSSITCSLFIGFWILYQSKHKQHLYKLNIRCFDEHCEQMVLKEINREDIHYELHTKIMDDQGITLCLFLNVHDSMLLNNLYNIKGVEDIGLRLWKGANYDDSLSRS